MFVAFLLWFALAGAALGFSDVPSDHRYADAIDELAETGMVAGRGDGTFGPDEPVYRAQFAKMLCRLLEFEVVEEQSYEPFVDLGPDDPADLYPHEYVGAAYRGGITNGTGPTTFSPYAPITLPQVLTMVVRAMTVHRPGSLRPCPPDRPGCWAAGDPTHGVNIRRAEYNDLLDRIPIRYRWSDVCRPATRGEVCRVLVNLRHLLRPVVAAFSFEGRPLELTHPPQVVTNRYYLPFADLAEGLGGKVVIARDSIRASVRGGEVLLTPSAARCSAAQATFSLLHRPLVTTDAVYVALIDAERMLDLKVVWDETGGVIRLFWNRGAPTEVRQGVGGRTALLRFEDISANQRYATGGDLQRLRAVFDYCYAKGIPMHLGWVPRYIDPAKGIDNAPAEDDSLHNAHFVYTLDYFTARGGLLGLHGYTHQHGEEVSLAGTEFDVTRNPEAGAVRARIRWALDAAERLDLPIAFFESPHYAATWAQKLVMAEYFDILYEPKGWGGETWVERVPVKGRYVLFVPTALGYVDHPVAKSVDDLIAAMKGLKTGAPASFFYHPYLEARYMTEESDEVGYPLPTYALDSPLHRLCDAFLASGYTFRSVTSLR